MKTLRGQLQKDGYQLHSTLAVFYVYMCIFVHIHMNMYGYIEFRVESLGRTSADGLLSITQHTSGFLYV